MLASPAYCSWFGISN